jgi:hypothetical protein
MRRAMASMPVVATTAERSLVAADLVPPVSTRDTRKDIGMAPIVPRHAI